MTDDATPAPDPAQHGHGHGHGSARWWARVAHAVRPHSHDSTDIVDDKLQASRAGMRALWISFAGLMVTALVQAVLVSMTGSVALLGDTLHNLADALTAVPLAVAFVLGRRAATRRFSYGLGRSEDLAGLVILLVMSASAVLAAVTALDRLLQPQEVRHLGWVAAAGVVGFAGNELVARYRITVGRRIGSAALVADGLHARTDGFTSLGVLLAAGGAGLGFGWADPVIGLAITAAIVAVLCGAAKEVFARILDAVDPELHARAEAALRATPGVLEVASLRMRWVGHRLHAETDVVVAAHLSVLEAHAIAAEAEHHLLHAVDRLSRATVHTDPATSGEHDPHAPLAHHRSRE
ncbi:cation diffusion facilitator family transporter [Saccharopolyspora halophila]|uniref:Cation diffusion facilitator family transporter n=1 Tax=Saccharopolyspora halophila TaxID=405551 RepID=A0ABN3GI20_9PSEU